MGILKEINGRLVDTEHGRVISTANTAKITHTDLAIALDVNQKTVTRWRMSKRIKAIHKPRQGKVTVYSVLEIVKLDAEYQEKFWNYIKDRPWVLS